jgi:hypothetical protein
MMVLFPWWGEERKKRDEPAHYFTLDLSPEQRDALDDLVNGRKVPQRAVERLRTALMFARKVSLPMVRLSWGEVERLAHQQKISEADVLWDLMSRPGEKP